MFDFKSLYPSIIRTFNIDPLSYVANPANDDGDLIHVPGGAFRRSPAILPRMLDELFPKRAAARQAGDDVASNAIKILMNSFLWRAGNTGLPLLQPGSREFHHGHGARAVLWSKRWFEAAGFEVL